MPPIWEHLLIIASPIAIYFVVVHLLFAEKKETHWGEGGPSI